ncbi:hypothetical protein [Natrinema ejinorense]|uniref:hypothetical protein n=1 Tax=Natrinema ejinorense TaxID=373386 RepID=UPI001FEBE187|nr:hypothetical protein [Natrinema ejinorense]
MPDVLGTATLYTVAKERIGMHLLVRLRKWLEPLADVEPARIIVGHGRGIDSRASAELYHLRANARRNFTQALRTNGWAQLRSFLGAVLY